VQQPWSGLPFSTKVACVHARQVSWLPDHRMYASSPCISRSDLRRARILPGYSGGTAGLAGEVASDGACSPAASSLFSLARGHLAGVTYSVLAIPDAS
jgi:hypothetical protein